MTRSGPLPRTLRTVCSFTAAKVRRVRLGRLFPLHLEVDEALEVEVGLEELRLDALVGGELGEQALAQEVERQAVRVEPWKVCQNLNRASPTTSS